MRSLLFATAALAALALPPARAEADPPYPRSTVITGIGWDTGTYRFTGVGSDLWSTTSGVGGQVLTAWGDGAVACPAYVSYGVAAVTGGPGTDLVATGCGPRGYNQDKIIALLAVGGTLYADVYLQGLPRHRTAMAIWSSSDRGHTWLQPSSTFTGSDLLPGAFVNFGPAYAGARDGYVYMTATRGNQLTTLYMARVPRDQVQTKSAYRYLTGPVTAPGWSPSPAAASPFFVDPNGVDGPYIVYDQGIGRYLLTVAHGREGQDGGRVGVFEGPEPWGPWATVDYRDGWLGMQADGSFYLGVSFPSAWMADGGRTLWAVFSCWSRTKKTLGVEACGKYNDRYNLMRATLTLAAPHGGRRAG